MKLQYPISTIHRGFWELPADDLTDSFRISFHTSGLTPGLPSLLRLFHLQNSLNPFLCQLMTVAGFTMMSESFQRLSNFENNTNRILSVLCNLALFCVRCKMINCVELISKLDEVKPKHFYFCVIIFKW